MKPMLRLHSLRLLGIGAVLCAAACTNGSTTAAPDPDPNPIAEPFQTDQILVMLEDDDDIEELQEDLQGLQFERVGQTSFFLLTLPAGSDVAEILDELDDDARVVASEPNFVAGSPEGGPSDVPTLGGDLLASIRPQPGLAPLRLDDAHALSRGAGVVIAIVDTGIDFTHPFFAGATFHPSPFDFLDRDADPTDERDGLDGDGDGVTDEQFGHGTFIASLVHTVAPDATLLPIRVLDADGFGTSSGIAAGITWAVDQGATVINVSVDVSEATKAIREAIEFAQDRGAVVVAAAGNSGLSDIIFPARFGDVVGVAAIDENGVVAPFSNTGSKVSLVAPGVDLIGAFPQVLSPSGTARWSGTSFAAPLVAAAAALLLSAEPGLSREKVVQRLRDTAVSVDPDNPGLVGRLGAGIVQPADALAGP